MLVDRKVWKRVLEYCRSFDVEAGESSEYMYSVRALAGTVTVFTQPGWKDGYYVALFQPPAAAWKDQRKRKVEIEIVAGAPPATAWPKEQAETLLREIVARAEALK